MMKADFSAKVPESNSDVNETLLVPSEPEGRDVRLKLTMPSAFLHQRGEIWKPPLFNVSFALDTRTDTATALSPIEEPAVVAVTLAIADYDMLEALYNSDHPRSTGGMEWIWSRHIEQRYGLNHVTNQVFLGMPLEDYLFDDGPHYHTSIYCRPSGNAYPSLCTLTAIGERGGGIKPTSTSAVRTDIVFRREKLPEWKGIRDHVDAFLNDKMTVIEWEN